MLRGRKETVGAAIEELQKIRNKAKVESGKFQEKYVLDTITEAKSTVKRLQELLDTLQSFNKDTTDTEMLELVDKMYSILTETHTSLIKTEDNYDFWHTINKRFEE